jgi:pimeloyl-ACP methyl ester carboxylesterase
VNASRIPWRKNRRARLTTLAVAGAIVAATSAAAQAADTGPAAKDGCTRANHGRALSSTPLKQLDSAAASEDFRRTGFQDATARYGVSAYRLEYCTVSPTGSPTTASGLLALPRETADKILPTVLYEHGTTAGKTDVPSFLTGTENSVVPFYFSSAGYAVVAPDYLGLGTSPGRHPYLQAATEASASLDMLRAADAVSRDQAVALSRDVLISGHSQGGQAAMATGQALQRVGGPWRLAALAPMAGPYGLSGAESEALLDPTRTDPQKAAFYASYILTAWKDLYHLYTDPRQIFNEPYAGTVEALFDGTHSVPDIDAALPTPQELFRPRTLALLARPTGNYAAALRANDVCHWSPAVPTRLYAAHGDTDVVFANAEQCRQQITARGGTAQIVDMGTTNHVGTAIASLPLIRTWFNELTHR